MRVRPSRLTREYTVRALAALAVLLLASVVAGALVGGVALDFGRALDPSSGSVDGVILFGTRLPRVFLGVVVGGALGAAGAALQALLRNALASPDVIGVSGGASVGAVVAIGLVGAGAAVPAAAFAGALATIALVVRLGTLRGRIHPYSLLLVGVVVNTIASALILLVSSLVDALQAHGILFWLAGSLAERRYWMVGLVGAAAVLATLALWRQANALNVLSLGEESAAQLGTDVPRVRRVTFLASSFLVAVSVAVSGVIGFVGLIVPHCLRMLVGPDLRLLIPAAFLGGGAFLVLADTAARSVLAPTEIPVGVLTALAGGPFFIFLLRRQTRGSW